MEVFGDANLMLVMFVLFVLQMINMGACGMGRGAGRVHCSDAFWCPLCCCAASAPSPSNAAAVHLLILHVSAWPCASLSPHTNPFPTFALPHLKICPLPLSSCLSLL